ncbi:MAG: DUF3147 family protein [Steroidobacteraceae bacterium]
MQLLWRFLLGGALVSAFALIADVLRPKRFAGLFAAAPSVAIATLALTASVSGTNVAATEARSMMVSSFAFVVYAFTVERVLANTRWPALTTTLAALPVWLLIAWGAGAALTRL